MNFIVNKKNKNIGLRFFRCGAYVFYKLIL